MQQQGSIKDLLVDEVNNSDPSKLNDFLKMLQEKDWSNVSNVLKAVPGLMQVNALKGFIDSVLAPIAEAQQWVKALIHVVQVVVEVKRCFVVVCSIERTYEY